MVRSSLAPVWVPHDDGRGKKALLHELTVTAESRSRRKNYRRVWSRLVCKCRIWPGLVQSSIAPATCIKRS